MMGRFRSAFSYYGGKGRIAHLYPEPRYPYIIEPFAGAAGYSVYHRAVRRCLDPKPAEMWDVWLNDIDRVAEIWYFIRSLNSGAMVPDLSLATRGKKINELPGADSWPPGLLYLLQSEGAVATQGQSGECNKISKFGEVQLSRIHQKMAWIAPVTRTWRITKVDYREIPNAEVTWFIDPPYNNKGGRRYRHHDIDYAELAEWCRSRQGQVIVCEQQGATWLPFTPLSEAITQRCGKPIRDTAGEAVWYRPPTLKVQYGEPVCLSGEDQMVAAIMNPHKG